MTLSPAEPIVLHHGDFQGRNILMRGTDIAGIIDWEFAGAYPLSELLLYGQGPDVLEMVDDETTEECFDWNDRIGTMVREEAVAAGWGEEEVEWLCGEENSVLGVARMEMIPRDST